MSVDLNTVALIVLALVNAFTAIMAFQTRKLTLIVEKNTNSMKDALVASTAKASHAEGKAEGKVEERAEEEARK